MSYFKDWFFNKLSNYYHSDDSYKDDDGKGLLQRYLENIGEDIDDNILPFIDTILNIIDPTTQSGTNYKFLNTLAYTVGSPPDIFLGDPAQNAKYAKLINHIVSIYKIKGTKKSYELFFALLGYIITVIEYSPTPATIFDSEYTFDDGFEFDRGCEPCSEYSILSQAILVSGSCGASGNPVLDPSMYDLMVQVAKFLEPINATLKSIITGGIICEDVEFCFQEDITFELREPSIFDLSTVLFDSDDSFDEYNVVSTTTINVTC